ncbi:MAG TPA: type II toxin-antitoxin system HicB family antitoxin [Phototrophicaceae bacterium]|nr:type II toxin-antitoxin system HicB family antitoxin [Phototrophicaceae bacterium]
MMSDPKNLDYYVNLPYTIELTPAGDGSWFAKIPLLPGCMTVGDTQQEALEMIEDAKLGWLSVALEEGDIIPEPQPVN